MAIVDREVVGRALTFRDSQSLRARYEHDPVQSVLFGGAEHVPRTDHVRRDDLLRGPDRVVGERRQMDHGVVSPTARFQPLEIEEILRVDQVVSRNLVARAGQPIGDGGTDEAPVASDDHPHLPTIASFPELPGWPPSRADMEVQDPAPTPSSSPTPALARRAMFA